MANKKIIFAIVIILIAGFFFVAFKSKITANIIGNKNVREINVDAKMFEFNPSVIKVKEGEKVIIKINSLDVEHSISIPELGIDIHDKGVFIANKKGEFEFSCHSYCGPGHDAMKGVLIVE